MWLFRDREKDGWYQEQLSIVENALRKEYETYYKSELIKLERRVAELEVYEKIYELLVVTLTDQEKINIKEKLTK